MSLNLFDLQTTLAKNISHLRQKLETLSTGIKLKTKYFCILFWALTCGVGFIYKLQEITIDYLSYSMVTKTSIEIPRRVTTPAISICYKLTNITIPGESLICSQK